MKEPLTKSGVYTQNNHSIPSSPFHTQFYNKSFPRFSLVNRNCRTSNVTVIRYTFGQYKSWETFVIIKLSVKVSLTGGMEWLFCVYSIGLHHFWLMVPSLWHAWIYPKRLQKMVRNSHFLVRGILFWWRKLRMMESPPCPIVQCVHGHKQWIVDMTWTCSYWKRKKNYKTYGIIVNNLRFKIFVLFNKGIGLVIL